MPVTTSSSGLTPEEEEDARRWHEEQANWEREMFDKFGPDWRAKLFMQSSNHYGLHNSDSGTDSDSSSSSDSSTASRPSHMPNRTLNPETDRMDTNMNTIRQKRGSPPPNSVMTAEEAEKRAKSHQPKLEVNPNNLKKTHHSSILPSKVWQGQKMHEHMALVGSTKSGKTFRFLTFLADQKIPLCDRYFIVGDSPQRDEIVKGICALFHLSGRALTNTQVEHYQIRELDKVLAMCLDAANLQQEKYIFFNDCLISENKHKLKIANFANRATNFKTTVCVEIHHLAGENMLLLRKAFVHKVYCNLPPKELARELDAQKNEDIIIKYAGLPKNDRVIISQNDQGEFSKHYTPF